MLTCQLQGGLGNQLFQIFTTMSYAFTHKKVFTFTNQTQLDTKRHTYWNTFLSSLAKFTKVINFTQTLVYKEKDFSYDEIPYRSEENILLYGYFQSEKYFEKHAKNIMKIIKLEEQKNRIIKNHNIKNNISLSNTISVHFRRGDYKVLHEHYPILTYDYYNKAIDYIIKDRKEQIKSLLIFCERNDLNDIVPILNQLKTVYLDIKFQIMDFNISDWEQLLIMSMCQHNIIANSSFSWWGAYFNTNPNKIVCYPEKWFGEKLKHYDTKDLCPTNWVKISSI